MFHRILLLALSYCLWCRPLVAQEERVVYCRDFDWIALRTIEPVAKVKEAFFKVKYCGDTLKSVEIKVNRRKLETYRKRKKWRGAPILRYHSEFGGHAVYENRFFIRHPWTNAVFSPSIVYNVNKNDSTVYQVGFHPYDFSLEFIRYIKQEQSADKISVTLLNSFWHFGEKKILNDSIRTFQNEFEKVQYCLNLLMNDALPRSSVCNHVYESHLGHIEVSSFYSDGSLRRTWKSEALEEPYYYLFFIINRNF